MQRPLACARSGTRTLVVRSNGLATAYPEYLAQHVYVCQPLRTFRDGLTHLGFYAEKAIQPDVARILYREDAVVFSPEEAARRRNAGGESQLRIAETIDELLKDGSRQLGESYQVFLLSGPDEAATVKLARPSSRIYQRLRPTDCMDDGAAIYKPRAPHKAWGGQHQRFRRVTPPPCPRVDKVRRPLTPVPPST